MSDPYSILGVQKTATLQEIKKAYRRLALENHPDRNNDNPAAAEKFKEISAAYSTIGSEESRAKYEESLRHHSRRPQSHRSHGFDDFFNNVNRANVWEDLFGKASAGRRNGNPFTINAQIDVTLEDIVKSVKRSFILENQTIEFQVPKTSRPGQSVVIPIATGQELHVRINLIPHPVFSFLNDDLFCTLEIPVETAILGGSIQAPTLEGSVNLKIPPQTSSHSKLRIRNAGLYKQSGGCSSIIYEIKINTKKISPKLWDAIS